MIRARTPVPIVTAREYGMIELPRKLNTPATRERLEAAGQRLGLRTFESRGSSLHALGIVGVIDIGNVIVEILPKSGEAASPLDGAAFLSRLLTFVGDQRAPAVAEAAIREDGGGLFEIILAWAVRHAAALMEGGLARRYVPVTEVSSAVRGRIDLRHLASQRPGRGFELLVRHAPLSEDNLIARIVRWLLQEVARRTVSPQTRTRALRTVGVMGHVADIRPQLHEIDRLSLTALEEHWRPLLVLARSLLVQATPDPARAGGLDSLAILYSLHRLFEDALRRILREGLSQRGYGHVPHHGALLHGDAGDMIALKPDFHFSGAPQLGGLVGDAKWKRIFQTSERVRLSEDDAYQIAAYLTATKAERAFLISPVDTPDRPLVSRIFNVEGADKPLLLVGVHLPALIAAGAAGDGLRSELCCLVAGIA